MTATLHRLATVATTVLVLVGVVGVGAYFIQAAATRRTAAVTTADCANKDFGPPLAPLGEPANLHQYHAAPPFTIDRDRLYEATIATKVGDIVVCLVPGWAPETVNSFVTLARNHFFDGLSWARDPSTAPGGPVIQGGSPHSNLTGGPGYKFKDEKVVSPLYRDGAYQEGAVAMA
ncbi:MAG: peptidylprolyl isomerase, partial [Candidatus Dormibacteria bacterium]